MIRLILTLTVNHSELNFANQGLTQGRKVLSPTDKPACCKASK